MDMNREKLQSVVSNASVSGSLALAGLGVEALAHNPIFLFAGGLVAYASWKYNAGEKLVELRSLLKDGRIDGASPAPRPMLGTLPDTEKLEGLRAPYEQRPLYRVADALVLGVKIDTGERFDPLMDDLLGQGVLLAGSQGAGKSNIVGLIAQSAGTIGMPFLIIDFKGEFYPLIDVVPNGIVAGHPDGRGQFANGYYSLTSENAADLAQAIMEGPFQVILDVPSYNGDNDEVAAVIANLLHGMMDWSHNIKKQGGEPWPCLVITDEAHNFLPERRDLSALVMQNPKESYGALTKAYSRMANTGRSFGYTLVMATQRLPNIAKWSIANLQVKVVMRHSEKNDLDACMTETGGLIEREDIKRLEQGTGIVVGFAQNPLIVRFDKQRARHVSITPKVAHLKQQFQGTASRRISQVLPQHSLSRQPKIVDATPDTLSLRRMEDLPVRETVSVPVERCESGESAVSTHPVSESVSESSDPGFTHEDVAVILNSYAEMNKAKLNVTRQSLLSWMHENVGISWNQKRWTLFKAVCDTYGICQKEGK